MKHILSLIQDLTSIIRLKDNLPADYVEAELSKIHAKAEVLKSETLHHNGDIVLFGTEANIAKDDREFLDKVEKHLQKDF